MSIESKYLRNTKPNMSPPGNSKSTGRCYVWIGYGSPEKFYRSNMHYKKGWWVDAPRHQRIVRPVHPTEYTLHILKAKVKTGFSAIRNQLAKLKEFATLK